MSQFKESVELNNEIIKVAYDALDDKLAEDIKVLDIRNVTVLADYFIIANGKNVNHIKSLVDQVEDKLAEAGVFVKHREGNDNGSWVLLDFGDLVVHLFGKEDRYFYDLERIWADGIEVTF